MKLNFVLARKFSRNTVKGLELRTASLTRAVIFNTKGDGYEKVRDAAARFEMLEGPGHLRMKGIGKSWEITGDRVMGFLATLTFVNESQNDFLNFFQTAISQVGEPVRLDLSEKAAMVEMTAEVPDRENAKEALDEFVRGLLPILEKYDIGIVYQ